MFWLLDAVGGLLVARSSCESVVTRSGTACFATRAAIGRRWLRDLSDEFAYFRDAYRFFRS